MINPSAQDIGRAVLYTGNRYSGGKPEYGVISSFNSIVVFVRYGADQHSKATSRSDLVWEQRPRGEAMTQSLSERLRKYAGMPKNMVMTDVAMREAADALDRQATLLSQAEAALEQIVEEKCDYMRLNNLGDPETQHTVKAAREVLAAIHESKP